jgi:hypothetical protein
MHVYLLDSPENDLGTASVSGVLMKDRGETGQSLPLSNIPVYLADAKDGCYIAAGITGENGEFCFSHLVTGEFCFKAEYQRLVMCDERAVLNIDADGLHFDIESRLDSKKMTTTVRGNRSGMFMSPLDKGISFKPNPSLDGKLYLIMKDSFKRLKLEITDLAGWIVRTMDLGEIQAGYTDALDLDDLEKGTYLLEITTNRDRLSKQLVLQ